MKRYLIDTCVWIDFLEDRSGHRGRNLGKYANNMLKMIFDEDSEILISEAVSMN